ncbi:hypothetical protein HDU79_000573, partial [Rhizoclosmatium sp. JEL0117]
MLGPTYPYMVKHLLPGEERIGYFAGLLQPVLLIGLLGYGVGTMLLGLSTSFNFSLFALFLTGCFAGNTIVAKGMIGELTKDDRSRALGYSWYGIVYGICGVVGAVMGGYLADPDIFVGVPVLEQRPYLLACSIGVSTALVSGIIVLRGLQAPKPGQKGEVVEMAVSTKGYNQIMFDSSEESYAPALSAVPRKSLDSGATRRRISGVELDITDSIQLETMESALAARKERLALETVASPEDSDPEDEEDMDPNQDFFSKHIRPYLNILTRRTIVPLSLYTLFCLSNAIFLTALSLIAAAPVAKGGYNLSQRVAFNSMFVYAFMKILVKGFYYKTNSVFGTKWTYRLGVALMLPAILFVPFRFGLDWTKYQASLVELGKSAGEAVASRDTSELQSLVVRSFSSLGNKIHDGGYEVPVYGLVLLMCFMGTGDGLTYLSVVMLITDSVPET